MLITSKKESGGRLYIYNRALHDGIYRKGKRGEKD